MFVVCIVGLFATQVVNAQTGSSTLTGTWRGMGMTTDGKPFTLTFDLQNGALTGLLYSFAGTDGISCSAISYAQIPSTEQAKIADDKLTAILGNDVVFSAAFRNHYTF